MKRIAVALLALVALAFAAPSAFAQGQVTTVPYGVTSTISASSISVSNTFQTAIASSATRRGCLIQNTSANTMYLWVGVITSATTARAIQLPTKTFFNCTSGGTVITDLLSVTGSSGDTYTTLRQ